MCKKKASLVEIAIMRIRFVIEIEELRNSHGGMIRILRTGVGASYLCCSNCDEIKCSALTMQGLIIEAVKDSSWNCSLFIAPRRR